jgi:hypothetical protein
VSGGPKSTTAAGGQPGRVTAAAFLEPFEDEQAGFGLYSYILLGSRPESLGSERWQRYQQTIAAFLGMPDVLDVIKYLPKQRINLTLLPLTCNRWEWPAAAANPLFHFDPQRLEIHLLEHSYAGVPPSPGVDGPYDRSNPEAACMLVGNYNYARAAALLSLFGRPHAEGPYIVSATQPLSKAAKLPSQFLYQDLSSVPPEMAVIWVRAFMNQARKQEFWLTDTEEEFIVGLRTLIARASRQLPDFHSAIKWNLATVTPQR